MFITPAGTGGDFARTEVLLIRWLTSVRVRAARLSGAVGIFILGAHPVYRVVTAEHQAGRHLWDEIAEERARRSPISRN